MLQETPLVLFCRFEVQKMSRFSLRAFLGVKSGLLILDRVKDLTFSNYGAAREFILSPLEPLFPTSSHYDLPLHEVGDDCPKMLSMFLSGGWWLMMPVARAQQSFRNTFTCIKTQWQYQFCLLTMLVWNSIERKDGWHRNDRLFLMMAMKTWSPS